MARVNKTKYAILGVLSLRPCSGYDIKKFCDHSIAHFWSENYGHIYPVLKQLEAEGAICKETEFTEGKPARNVYRLTDKGRNELKEWLLQSVEPEPHRMEFLLQLFFSKDIPLEIVLTKLKSAKEECEKILQQYLKIEMSMKDKKNADENPSLPFWRASLRYGIQDVRGKIDWCSETIQELILWKEKSNQKGDENL